MHLPALYRLVAACLLSLLAASAAAQTPISTEDFFRLPDTLAMRQSPDGKHLAGLVAADGRMNLAVINIAEQKGARITAHKEADVVSFAWVNNDRLVYSLGDLQAASGGVYQNYGGLFAVNKDASDFRKLYPTRNELMGKGMLLPRGAIFGWRSYPWEADSILAFSNDRNVEQQDAYVVNTKTGAKRLLVEERPSDVLEFELDRNGVVRFLLTAPRDAAKDGPLTYQLHYRSNAASPWKMLRQWKLGEPSIRPLAFDFDNKTAFVASDIGRDKQAIFRYDPETDTLGELVAASDDVDLTGGLVFDSAKKQLAGVYLPGYRPQVKWFDPDREAVQAALNVALPLRFNRIVSIGSSDEGSAGEVPPATSQMLVVSYSDRQSAEWFLFDRDKRALSRVGRARPWLDPSKLVPMQAVQYKARDGLKIPGYLFVPSGSEGKKLPLIVYVHGGPHARGAEWQFSPVGQFLASRGYAVLMPEFRLSTGYGRELHLAGFRQFGKSPIEDLEDGVQWLVERGLVDPKRVCIAGGSYGGYASLVGVAKTPSLYRCAWASFAVTDLVRQLTSPVGDTVYSDLGSAYWRQMAGDADKDRAMLDAASPVNLAGSITAPVKLVFGGEDKRVPIEQGSRMRNALERAKVPYEWLVFPDEGHGLGKLENRVKYHNEMLEFFNKNTGQPPSKQP